MTAEINTVKLTLRLSADLKDRVEATSIAEGVSVNVWVERLVEANALPEKKTMSVQHKEPRRLLPPALEPSVPFEEKTIGEQHKEAHRLLSLLFEASRRDWDLRASTRMKGDITDLLDAAAVLAGVPLIALYTLRGSRPTCEALNNDPDLCEQLLEEAKRHAFTQTDIANIEAQLDKLLLLGMGHTGSWRHILNTVQRFKHLEKR